MPSRSDPTRVTLLPLMTGRRGTLYEVRLGEEVLVAASRDPEHDAARALVARGITGRMNVYDQRGVRRSSWPIEKTAGFMIEEGDLGAKRRRWRDPSERLPFGGSEAVSTASADPVVPEPVESEKPLHRETGRAA